MDGTWITDWARSTRFPNYIRSNAGEVLPTPASPLGQQFTWERGICLGWRDGYVRCGSYTLDEFDPVHPEACGFFGGYMHIGLANVRMQGLHSPAATVEQLDLAFFGDHPDVPPYRPHRFGSRGPNEWEISAETWETMPELALAALDRVRGQDDHESPMARNRRLADERGVAGSPGKVVGTARIVTDPEHPGDLGPDDILVGPLTDPAWTPLFMAVSGVVVDVGGEISHAIIVSRELGMPCVVSATGASDRIADGETIEVDADHDTVTVLAVPA